MTQPALVYQCERCREWHSDGNWLLCHACAGPAFRAWYVAGAVTYAEACAIFAALIALTIWRPA